MSAGGALNSAPPVLSHLGPDAECGATARYQFERRGPLGPAPRRRPDPNLNVHPDGTPKIPRLFGGGFIAVSTSPPLWRETDFTLNPAIARRSRRRVE